MKKSVRTRLAEERKRRKWSQQEVADFIGTTQRNVSRWELGLTTLGPYFRSKLEELFGKQSQELELLERPADADPPSAPSVLHGPSASLPIPDQLSPLWHVPSPRNPFFTEREQILHHVHDLFSRFCQNSNISLAKHSSFCYADRMKTGWNEEC